MKQIDVRDLRERIATIDDPDGTTPVTRRFLEEVERELTEARLIKNREPQ